MTTELLIDIRSISEKWLTTLNLENLVATKLEEVIGTACTVDIVAIGKASQEMESAARLSLGKRVNRSLVISDTRGEGKSIEHRSALIGDHPIPRENSLFAGLALIDFLDQPTSSECTLFLVSGGASSLCALPAPPLDLGGLEDLWRAALRSGLNITDLNKIRASTSLIAGGATLRHVKTPHSFALIMVDNVMSGAEWVASGLTFEHDVSSEEFQSLLKQLDCREAQLLDKLQSAFAARNSKMTQPQLTTHRNEVIAEPRMLHDIAVESARELGYAVVDMGGAINDDVDIVAQRWREAIQSASKLRGPTCLVGVGEVTVRVKGSGLGGRCQEFAWTMSEPLAHLSCSAVFMARASDGRDFIEGVAGAWVDSSTAARAKHQGFDWKTVKESNDSHNALSALGQLIAGQHTGWNLCDLYLAVVDPST